MQYHRQLLFSSLFAEAIINLLYYFVPIKKLQERTPKEIASDEINDSVAWKNTRYIKQKWQNEEKK